MVTQTVNLDLVPSQFGRSNVTVPCSQYDKEFRVIQFVIYNKKALFNIPSGSVVTIRGTKPQDNTGFEYECNFNGNLVTFPLKEQITVYHGLIPAELRITKNGEIIGSANFVFMVEESPLKDNTVISDTDLPLLQEALNAVDETLSYRNEAETFSQDAEAWAVGTRNGEDVDSDDPTYENNSKYYSEEAKVSEENAETSATNAENYKNLASQYADNASASALSASNSATSASESATSASESAQSASDSADRAEQIAQDVEGYVDDAEGYANEAKGYRDTASQYASNAQTYASNASSSATSASSSASNAQTYMNNAQASASQASQSATNAQTFATNASTSATNANASATSASQSATSASNSATSASESATNASTSATSAQTSAESASASATSAETSAEQAEAVLEEVIGIKDNFAEKDGFYPDMSVGHLLSDTTVDDEFTYQVTNYDGKAKINSIKGNTIVWNQQLLAPTTTSGSSGSADGSFRSNRCTYTYDSATHIITITALENVGTSGFIFATGNGAPLVTGHKYLQMCDVQAPKAFNFVIGLGTDTDEKNNLSANTYHRVSTIKESGSSSIEFRFNFNSSNAWAGTETVYIKNAMLFDLTQMFGAGNEPSTADEFTALFPLPYYQYDAGSLLSFNGTGIKTIGKNQVALPVVAYNTLYDLPLSGYFPILKGTYTLSYTANKNHRYIIKLVDANGNYLNDNVYKPNTNVYWSDPYQGWFLGADRTAGSFTFPVNIVEDCYIRIGRSYTNPDTIELTNVQLEVGSTATSYEPYTTSTTTIPADTYFPTGMKSAGSVYDELTNSKAITRVGEVDLGSLNWGAGFNGFYSTDLQSIVAIPSGPLSSNVICSKYPVPTSPVDSSSDKIIYIYPSTNESYKGWVIARDSDYSDAIAFKAAMDGVMLYYELATPAEEDVDLDLSYNTYEGGTEQLLPINTDVPVASPLSRNVTFYYENKDADNLAKIMAMIAPVENKTVSKAYTVGQYLIYDYVLYKVTSNIANGGTITVGTNVTATSIASILESL